MGDQSKEQVTALLQAATCGDTLATERLFPIVYDELRRMAAALMGHERTPQTLQPTALVNEAYLRLVDSARLPWDSRAHFFGAAARAMRRILIDRARHVKATRPGPAGPIDDACLPTLDGGPPTDRTAGDLLALDDALQALAARDERQYDIVMLRFFAGLTIEQTALALGLSLSTVKNEWSYARACLIREIEQRRAGGP